MVAKTKKKIDRAKTFLFSITRKDCNVLVFLVSRKEVTPKINCQRECFWNEKKMCSKNVYSYDILLLKV